jgi:hypothetical protein
MDTVGAISFATCFHEDEAHNGVSWGGEMSAIEPCDDILPDGVLTSGTSVRYFFELRNEATGEVLGTAPSGRNYTPIDTLASSAPLWLRFDVLPELIAPPAGGCDPNDPADRANPMLVIDDSEDSGIRGSVASSRFLALLDSFGLDYDYYATHSASQNGIGRREDMAMQQPRPPTGGATQAQLEGYSCIWYFGDLTAIRALSDFESGDPSRDQQALEDWLRNCIEGEERLLVLDGSGWASDIASNTTHGPAFLDFVGVEVLGADYAGMADDFRRCARVTGTPGTQPPGHEFDGEAFGSGCPDVLQMDVFLEASGGEVVTYYVDSHELAMSPVDCTDDSGLPTWAAIIRKASGAGGCRRSAALGISTVRLHQLNCSDECLFEEWQLGGGPDSPAQLIADIFAWANLPIGNPIAAPAGPAPRLQTRLIGSRPNPANPSATVTFSLAERGDVRLVVYDVNGRLVRVLIEDVLDASAEPYEVVWDGRDGAGRQVASGVFFYQLDAPNYTLARKLILLK